MQIVEYLYATLFGNDLHPRLEFLSAVSYPRTKQEYHLSVEPRKIFPPYISSIYRRNGNLSQSRYTPILVSRQSTLTRFLLSLDSIFRLMYPSYLINSSFHPYRIHDETPCYILTKKNKRACKVIRFELTDKVSNGVIFYFCPKRGNVLKRKKRNFHGMNRGKLRYPAYTERNAEGKQRRVSRNRTDVVQQPQLSHFPRHHFRRNIARPHTFPCIMQRMIYARYRALCERQM